MAHAEELMAFGQWLAQEKKLAPSTVALVTMTAGTLLSAGVAPGNARSLGLALNQLRSKNSRRTYRYAWRLFSRWKGLEIPEGEARALPPLPEAFRQVLAPVLPVVGVDALLPLAWGDLQQTELGDIFLVVNLSVRRRVELSCAEAMVEWWTQVYGRRPRKSDRLFPDVEGDLLTQLLQPSILGSSTKTKSDDDGEVAFRAPTVGDPLAPPLPPPGFAEFREIVELRGPLTDLAELEDPHE